MSAISKSTDPWQSLVARAVALAQAGGWNPKQEEGVLPTWSADLLEMEELPSIRRLSIPGRAQDEDSEGSELTVLLLVAEELLKQRALQDLGAFVEAISRVERATMSAGDADELRLWLVAPAGKEEDREWIVLRDELMRDTYTCTKTVWLPPNDAAQWSSSADAFLASTFLARPWSHTEETDAATRDLDAMTDRLTNKDHLAFYQALLTSPAEPQATEADQAATSPDDLVVRAVQRRVDAWLENLATRQDPEP